MSKVLFFVMLSVLLSCSKEKQSNKYLAGDWDIITYSEVIFDGTINKYDLISGSAHFDKLSGGTASNFQLNFKAVGSFDTVEKTFNGTYKRRTIDTLEFNVDTEIYLFEITRIFKKDLNLQGGLAPDRKSIFIMKKK
jgi:hypothetical protein|tara:strand:- start:3304 stop:3714 length:411 start_codon:yes stop_codon:yes gene_type:complete